MIVRFRLGNITETRPVHGKLDHHVSAGRKRGGFKQLHVSVAWKHVISSCVYDTPFASIYRDFTVPRLRQFTEILRYPVCVNLQRLYDAQFFLNLQQCNSQTFYVRRPITVKSL